MTAPSPYRRIGSLERGLALLDALADLGWSTPAELAAHTGIERSTVYRLLNTLVLAGYAARRDDDGRWFLAPRVRSLGFGIRADDVEQQIAQEELDRLVGEIGWPSDYAALIAGRLTILASSHRLTTMTFFRRLVGKHRPLFRSALGRALLAAMSSKERDETLEILRSAGGPDAEEIVGPETLSRLVGEAQARGYASSDGLIESSVSAIGLAVRRSQRPVGAVNVVYFRTAMTPATAAATFLEPLRGCVSRIEARLDQC